MFMATLEISDTVITTALRKLRSGDLKYYRGGSSKYDQTLQAEVHMKEHIDLLDKVEAHYVRATDADSI